MDSDHKTANSWDVPVQKYTIGEGRYDDIIHLEHPTSRKHPRLSKAQRAGQFAPFAALTGLDDKMDTTAEKNTDLFLHDLQTEEEISWNVGEVDW